MNIGFIGLGEAAGAIISGWKGAHHVRAYDRKLDDSATAGEILERGNSLGVTVCATGAETVEAADLVFSTVTADQAVAVAEAHGAALKAGAIWCDLNSCAPKSKEVAAHVLRATGGRYLDVAVMAPVYPKCNMVPCLISGPEAKDWAPVLASLPMDVRVVGDTIGRASESGARQRPVPDRLRTRRDDDSTIIDGDHRGQDVRIAFELNGSVVDRHPTMIADGIDRRGILRRVRSAVEFLVRRCEPVGEL